MTSAYTTHKWSRAAMLWFRFRIWLVRCIILPRTAICINCRIGVDNAMLSFDKSHAALHNVYINMPDKLPEYGVMFANGQRAQCTGEAIVD